MKGHSLRECIVYLVSCTTPGISLNLSSYHRKVKQDSIVLKGMLIFNIFLLCFDSYIVFAKGDCGL